MSNISEAKEKVCNIIYDFLNSLYMRGVNRERTLQFAMAILCKAKGQCNVLTRVEEELSIYGLKDDDISKLVAEIQSLCEDKKDDILPACSDTIMDKFTNGPRGVYLQPRELTELVQSLMKKKGCKVVYNPFAGLASYAIAPFIEKYYGQEIDFTTRNIAKMRLELNNIDYSNYELGDSIKEWNDHDADCIVSTPPFGMKLHPFPGILSDVVSCEDYLLRRFISSDSEYAFFVLSKSTCNSSLFQVRKDICDMNLLDMVIDLPSGIFSSTNIATSIIVLSKKRSVNQPITIIDAESLFTSKKGRKVIDTASVLEACKNENNENNISLNSQILEENSYIWNAGFYKAEKNTVIPEGFSLVEFGTITSRITGIRDFSETKGRIVNIADLSRDVSNCMPQMGIVNIERSGMYNKIEEPTLLLSPIRELKPNFFNASPEDPIFVNINIWAFRITKEWVNPQYLCLQLSKANHLLSGLSIPRIPREQLGKTKLAFPSIGLSASYKEQEQLYKEFVRATMLSKAKEMGLLEVIDKMKADYINVVRTRKHDMMPYVRELGSFERTIRHYVSMRDDIPDFSDKMNSLIDRYKENLAKLSELINVFSEEQQFGEPEQFNLNKYLIELEINHDESKGYWIEYDRDDNALAEYGIPVSMGVYTDTFEPIDSDSKLGKELIEEDSKFPVIVDINHLDFERLVRNIIENAITHGFTDPNRNDYGIGIDLTVDMERGMFQIDFSNNGTPLPTGMDKQRYGLLGEKAGLTGRTGRGGYIVKSIVEHFHGDYDVFMNGSNTVIRILLPVANYDYEDEYDI